MFLECLGRRVRRHRCGERPCRRPAGTVTVARFGDLRHYDAGTRWLPCPNQLRQNPVTAIIPFIFITAMTEAERRLGMYLERMTI